MQKFFSQINEKLFDGIILSLYLSIKKSEGFLTQKAQYPPDILARYSRDRRAPHRSDSYFS